MNKPVLKLDRRGWWRKIGPGPLHYLGPFPTAEKAWWAFLPIRKPLGVE